MSAVIERCSDPKQPDWLEMRIALWPHDSREVHLSGMMDLPSRTDTYAVFLARSPLGEVTGFAEAAIRRDYVNGTSASPVGFLEGIYVEPNSRRRGFARELVDAVEAWVLSMGCNELASDAYIENALSHEMHQRLGFVETERVVYFVKRL